MTPEWVVTRRIRDHRTVGTCGKITPKSLNKDKNPWEVSTDGLWSRSKKNLTWLISQITVYEVFTFVDRLCFGYGFRKSFSLLTNPSIDLNHRVDEGATGKITDSLVSKHQREIKLKTFTFYRSRLILSSLSILGFRRLFSESHRLRETYNCYHFYCHPL